VRLRQTLSHIEQLLERKELLLGRTRGIGKSWSACYLLDELLENLVELHDLDIRQDLFIVEGGPWT